MAHDQPHQESAQHHERVQHHQAQNSSSTSSSLHVEHSDRVAEPAHDVPVDAATQELEQHRGVTTWSRPSIEHVGERSRSFLVEASPVVQHERPAARRRRISPIRDAIDRTTSTGCRDLSATRSAERQPEPAADAVDVSTLTRYSAAPAVSPIRAGDVDVLPASSLDPRPGTRRRVDADPDVGSEHLGIQSTLDRHGSTRSPPSGARRSEEAVGRMLDHLAAALGDTLAYELGRRARSSSTPRRRRFRAAGSSPRCRSKRNVRRVTSRPRSSCARSSSSRAPRRLKAASAPSSSPVPPCSSPRRMSATPNSIRACAAS